ncbi:hypothetical protein BDW59DRAFT_151830 [Aspergillus cavernicola]|uniref:Mid2 domain-containing protein n=1 Tax=Aspergillus cavernicola TaxID=176166 RepID=A0ABR4HTH1_9EURO
MLMLFVPRADDSGIPPQADPKDDSGSSDKTTAIIIGVVIGGVAAIAITAGIIFFLIKKRKWDRIRQCEERLLDYQLATGYSSKMGSRSVTPEDHLNMMASQQPRTSTTTTTTTTTYPYSSTYNPSDPQASESGNRPGSRARGMSAPASTTLQSHSQSSAPEAPPPAYQTLHQRYDPSQYSRMSSSFEFPRSSTSTIGNGNPSRSTGGLSISVPGHNHNPTGGSSLSPPEPSTYHQYQPWSSRVRSATTPSGSNNASARGSGSGSGSDSERLNPQRPRPVLSRIITNL